MKRFHVHLSVLELHKNIEFYSTLFGAAPVVVEADYAKWMLDDPRVNFAISTRDRTQGVNHLGFQVDSGEELAAIEQQLRRADEELVTESAAACCYARSDKYWVTDPQGLPWETFHTLGRIATFGGPVLPAVAASATPAACCAPATPASKGCCA